MIRSIRHKGLKPTGESFFASFNRTSGTSIRSTITEKRATMPMKNPPHPGGFVMRQCLEPLRLSVTEAAAALGVTRTTLSELVNERRGISPEMAVRLSKVFGGSAESWLVQQAQYDLAQVPANRIKLKKLEVG
jgi:addiction module HigA family antidote